MISIGTRCLSPDKAHTHTHTNTQPCTHRPQIKTETHTHTLQSNVRFANYVMPFVGRGAFRATVANRPHPFCSRPLFAPCTPAPVEAIISKATGLEQPRQNSSTHTHSHIHWGIANGSPACCCCCCWHSKLCHTFFNILARNALKFVARRINASTVCVCVCECLTVAKANERAKRAAKGGKAKPKGS